MIIPTLHSSDSPDTATVVPNPRSDPNANRLIANLHYNSSEEEYQSVTRHGTVPNEIRI